MQIVIDIPDDGYQISLTKIMLCLKDYKITELPKGHGRLIDADKLKKHKYFDINRHENAVSVAQIDWQPAIVEANKAESKDKG